VFLNCTITNDSIGFDGNPITNFILGRPWQNAPQTVFIKCYEPATLTADGWLSWNVIPAVYAEYNCSGPGFKPASRINNGRQLTDAEALNYTIEKIFSKNSATPAYSMDWVLASSAPTAVSGEQTIAAVKDFSLNQNYPNPFNPTTNISFSLKEAGMVSLDVYNSLGQKVASLIRNEVMSSGNHAVHFNAAQFTSGVYFYTLHAGNNLLTKKMILLK
jgi:hypothetical protein